MSHSVKQLLRPSDGLCLALGFRNSWGIKFGEGRDRGSIERPCGRGPSLKRCREKLQRAQKISAVGPGDDLVGRIDLPVAVVIVRIIDARGIRKVVRIVA